jgi:hypothetical protein
MEGMRVAAIAQHFSLVVTSPIKVIHGQPKPLAHNLHSNRN